MHDRIETAKFFLNRTRDACATFFGAQIRGHEVSRVDIWSVRARRGQHRCAQFDEALDDRFADPFGACRNERSHACEIQCVQCHIRYEVVNYDTFILAIHNLFHKNARKSK
ncbi:hypothetical protein PCAR4_170062 [Paraburkholderia caribensis]|nr:hypothetical protein PCAR4_170062 [Paraburkholderia caribensis]